MLPGRGPEQARGVRQAGGARQQAPGGQRRAAGEGLVVHWGLGPGERHGGGGGGGRPLHQGGPGHRGQVLPSVVHRVQGATTVRMEFGCGLGQAVDGGQAGEGEEGGEQAGIQRPLPLSTYIGRPALGREGK